MNELIEVDADTATQTAYLLFFAENGGAVDGTVCVYEDELVREDGAWKFADRKVRPVMPFAKLAASV